MMTRTLCAVALAAAAWCVSAEARPGQFGAYNGGQLTPSEMRAVSEEGTGKWREIRWAASPEAAVARAKAEDKPLFVFIIVGQHGQSHADHC